VILSRFTGWLRFLFFWIFCELSRFTVTVSFLGVGVASQLRFLFWELESLHSYGFFFGSWSRFTVTVSFLGVGVASQ